MNKAKADPANHAAEEEVLGGCFNSSIGLDVAMERLRSGHFRVPANQLIFEALRSLYDEGVEPNATIVVDRLERRGLLDSAGGAGRVVSLIAAAPVTSRMGTLCDIVLDLAVSRGLAEAGREITELGVSAPQDVTGAIVKAEELIALAAELRTNDAVLAYFGDVTTDVVAELLERTDSNRPSVGLSSGLDALDEIIVGLKDGALVVVGGRPAMGKTVLACVMARAVAIGADRPVLFVSLEMSKEELTKRVIAAEGKINASRLDRAQITGTEWERLNDVVPRIEGAPLRIYDDPNVTISSIRAQARKLRREMGDLGCIIIDYVQLMVGAGASESRRVEVDQISRGLKILARELDVPVVALAQLNRSVDGRADKRPMLSDLRESGSIEADADVVMFVYRDEVYHRDTEDRDVIEVIVAKNRSGPSGTARCSWQGHHQNISDMGQSRLN